MRYLLLIVSLCASLSVQAIDLPDMGSSTDAIMSPTEEREIGIQFMRQLRSQVEVLDDPEVSAYLTRLGYQLAAHSDMPGLAYLFFSIKDPSVNAFAVPGGFIAVNSGLLLLAEEESELASVMAHELAHVTQRHGARGTEKMATWSIPMMVGMVAAALLASQDSELGAAAMASVYAGGAQMQIDTTRRYEKEADRVGMGLLAESGFDPRSMPDFFQRMQEISRFQGDYPDFLMTHPLTTDRVAETTDRANTYPEVKPATSLAFHLMRAKVLVLTHAEPTQLFQQLQASLKNGSFRNETALRYALLLNALKLEKPDVAAEHLAWLRKHDGDREQYWRAEVELHRVNKQLDKAQERAEAGLRLYPGDVILTELYAQTLLDQGKPKQASDALLSLDGQTRPDHYLLLSQAQQAAKDPASVLAHADYFYYRGDTGMALELLRSTNRQQRFDFELNARIMERISKLEKELGQDRDTLEEVRRKRREEEEEQAEQTPEEIPEWQLFGR